MKTLWYRIVKSGLKSTDLVLRSIIFEGKRQFWVDGYWIVADSYLEAEQLLERWIKLKLFW